MFSNGRAGKILSVSFLSILSVLSIASHCVAQSSQGPHVRVARRNLENYKGQNGILSVKTVVLGGEFRVTTVVPFRGNVADYKQLEITRPISLVGRALSAEASNRQVAKIKSQFESKKLFESVTVIDSYNPALYGRQHNQLPTEPSDINRAEEDPLEAPLGSVENMDARDKQRALKEQELEQLSTRTLVTVIEVLDYAKGNRIKQILPLDLGKSILTVRLRYYDKASGQEIGRQIISGMSSGSNLLGPLSPRDALSGVADGFVDQVTRRLAASEK